MMWIMLSLYHIAMATTFSKQIILLTIRAMWYKMHYTMWTYIPQALPLGYKLTNINMGHKPYYNLV